MRYFKSGWILLMLLTASLAVTAQAIKNGTRVQVLVNNTWKEAVVIQALPGRTASYQVKLVDAAAKTGQSAATITVTAEKIKTVTDAPKQTTAKQPASATTETAALHLGRYELFSGIPSMNIGHFVLLQDGKYKVAFSDDQHVDYENGTYLFHPETNTIEWLSGLFHNNRWAGKIVAKNSYSYRIEFNKVTFGDSR